MVTTLKEGRLGMITPKKKEPKDSDPPKKYGLLLGGPEIKSKRWDESFGPTQTPTPQK